MRLLPSSSIVHDQLSVVSCPSSVVITLLVAVILMHSVDALTAVPPMERTVVLLYNKPKHVVTTHSEHDEKGRTNVYQDIMSMKGYVGPLSKDDDDTATRDFATVTNMNHKLHAVGRLDAETTGLLLLTNDGGLIHHVTASHCRTGDTITTTQAPQEAHPQSSQLITKTYQVLIMGYHSDDEENPNNNDSPQHDKPKSILHILRTQGVDIGAKFGGQCRPVQDLVVVDHPTPKSTSLLLTLSEGKNRQIRRMFHALGSGVMKLQRVRIGTDLTLEGIEEEGQWRILSDEEVRTSLQWEPRQLVEKQHSKPRKTTSSATTSSSTSNNNFKSSHGYSRRGNAASRTGPRRRRRK